MAGFVRWVRAEWDRAAGVGCLAAGAVALAVGYAGVADARYVPQALSFIASGGFFGLMLVAIGATLLITAALHDEWRKLDRLEAAIDRLASVTVIPEQDGTDEDGGALGRPDTPSHRAGDVGSGAARLSREDALTGSGSPALALRQDTRPALIVATGGLVVAAALIVGGWSSTASAVDDGTAYGAILVGIAGLAVTGLTSAGWTLSLRRASRLRQERLLAPLRVLTADDATGAGRAATAGADHVVTAEGLTRFHVRGCPAVTGLDVRWMERDAARRAGLTACRLCDSGSGH